jgi:hypothetical protein
MVDHANSAVAPDDWLDLADRRGDGIEVTLLWSRSTGRVKVAVESLRTGRHGELDVPAAEALEAFHHPFAYPISSRERPGARRRTALEPAPPTA